MFRRAVNVNSKLFQITVYELPPPEPSQEIAPTLKFIAYDPKTTEQVGNFDILTGLKKVKQGRGRLPFSVRLSWDKACDIQDRLSADFSKLGCIALLAACRCRLPRCSSRARRGRVFALDGTRQAPSFG